MSDDTFGAVRKDFYKLLESRGLDVEGDKHLHDAIKKLFGRYNAINEKIYGKQLSNLADKIHDGYAKKDMCAKVPPL